MHIAAFINQLSQTLRGLWARAQSALLQHAPFQQDPFPATKPQERPMPDRTRPLIHEAIPNFKSTSFESVLAPEGVGHSPNSMALAKSLAAQAGIDHTMGNLLRARLTVTPALLRRLFGLWNALACAGADQIADWSISTLITVECPTLPITIDVASVGVTVYMDGMVSFSVLIKGAETSLWFVDQFDLTAVEQVPLKRELNDRPAAQRVEGL